MHHPEWLFDLKYDGRSTSVVLFTGHPFAVHGRHAAHCGNRVLKLNAAPRQSKIVGYTYQR